MADYNLLVSAVNTCILILVVNEFEIFMVFSKRNSCGYLRKVISSESYISGVAILHNSIVSSVLFRVMIVLHFFFKNQNYLHVFYLKTEY